MLRRLRICASLVIVLASAVSVPARATPLDRGRFSGAGLSGDVQLSGSQTTGNTRASDLGAGAHVRYEGQRWRHLAAAQFDIAAADGEQTRNRIFFSNNGDLLFTKRLFGFGNSSYERDAFSGFNYRAVVAGGLGYDAYRRPNRQWTLRGGPGVRVERTRERLLASGEVLLPAETVATWVLRGESEFVQKLSENAEISNRTLVTAGPVSTNINNIAALTARIGGPFSVRLSFQISHETRPPLGALQTDTISRAALVYTFNRKRKAAP